MPRILCFIALCLSPTLAVAHPGHLAELAGHTHWVAGAAIGAAVVIGIWAGLKGRKANVDPSEDSGEDASSAAEPEAEGAASKPA